MIYNNILETIGNTPIIKLKKLFTLEHSCPYAIHASFQISRYSFPPFKYLETTFKQFVPKKIENIIKVKKQNNDKIIIVVIKY